MKLTLYDKNESLVRAWKTYFGGYGDVSIRHCELDDLEPHDVLVSPANSFGIMDGGIDLAIRDKFPGLQEAVTEKIADMWGGFQPPGTCELIVMPNSDGASRRYSGERWLWLAHTPTMPWPMPVPSIWVYFAMRALLNEISGIDAGPEYGRPPLTVACSGLGTLTGAVAPDKAAAIMKIAWIHHKNGEFCKDWEEAGRIIEEITTALL